ncbi:MAG: DUF433 domain-containing protein [Acidimicrobiia bacterium]|nr:DUF433 domain-containing protein [Acidimicrobiia bacterium]
MRTISTASDPSLHEMPPRGWYFAAEVGQLAGVSGNTVGQWKRRGYIQASQSADGYPNVYAYQDAAEAMVVHDLIDHDVPLRNIKRLIEKLRVENGRGWPLQAERLFVPNEPSIRRPVYVEKGEDFADPNALTPWNYVIDAGNLKLIAEQLHRGGWAVRTLPDLQHIEVDPDKMSGKPSIRGLRIAAEDVAVIAAESGHSVLKAEFGLNRQQNSDAVAWWDAVKGFEEAA